VIPDYQGAVYEGVLRAADEQGLKYAVGGGFCFSHHSNRWRNTKDIDLYILPESREQASEVVWGKPPRRP